MNKTQIEYNPAQSTTVGLNSLFGEAKLDRYELFPDIATSGCHVIDIIDDVCESV